MFSIGKAKPTVVNKDSKVKVRALFQSFFSRCIVCTDAAINLARRSSYPAPQNASSSVAAGDLCGRGGVRRGQG